MYACAWPLAQTCLGRQIWARCRSCFARCVKCTTACGCSTCTCTLPQKVCCPPPVPVPAPAPLHLCPSTTSSPIQVGVGRVVPPLLRSSVPLRPALQPSVLDVIASILTRSAPPLWVCATTPPPGDRACVRRTNWGSGEGRRGAVRVECAGGDGPCQRPGCVCPQRV